MKTESIDDAARKYFEDTDDGDGQQELFPDELEQVANILTGSEQADKYELKLALVLKPCRDNALPINVPIARGKCRSCFVEETIDIALKGSYFRKVLRAIIGEPSGDLSKQLNESKTQ